ncbi:MAG: chemotaxis protein CheW [Thermodesulfobacteriota bacterium]
MDEKQGTANQYLTFTLDNEVFALDIESVREVLELTHITRVPRTPEFMRGVINLRGHAVPVVDMRKKFGMPLAEDTVNTCIIIAEVTLGEESAVIGALVDSVREVFEIGTSEIMPPPRMGLSVKTDFIRGMGKQDEVFVMILDINKVFSEAEMTTLAQAGSQPPPAGQEATAM